MSREDEKLINKIDLLSGVSGDENKSDVQQINSRLQGPKILLVDDREENLFALERSLKPLGIESHRALSGKQALTLMLQYKYAVVILDVQMPEMDGFEVATLMQSYEETRDIPVIFVTAIHREQKYVSQGYNAGAVDYMTKPYNQEILLSKIRIFLKLDFQRSELATALKNLERLSHRNELILTCADEGILGINNEGLIAFINPAAASMLKYIGDDIIGKPVSMILVPPNAKNVDKVWRQSDIYLTLTKGINTRNANNNFWDKDGRAVPVEYSSAVISEEGEECSGVVVAFQDISERKELEQQLVRLARFDHLTNLANRTMFRDFLSGAMARTKRSEGVLAVMFLDLDNFKHVNDTLGHHVGDELLKRVAHRLKLAVRTGDLVARLGGDEFAIVLDDIEKTENARYVAEKIIIELEKPHFLDGKELSAKSSIGISTYAGGDENEDILIKAADTAMYAAKTKGRNNFQFFSTDMQRASELKFQLSSDLSQALKNDQLRAVFQPEIQVSNGEIVGCETLLRWQHPDKGMISPLEFIPLAEETSLINDIGDWVLEQSVKQVADWKKGAMINDSFSINVNVSVRQIYNPEFIRTIDRVLNQYAIDPKMLVLEVTESTLLDDTEKAIHNLCEIHRVGVRLAIDDFGTGYSSLSYLKRLPFDFLKIDRSFVQDIGVNTHDEQIVTTTISLAHNLGMKVIAEGVELEVHHNFLMENNCDYAQGYLYSKPVGLESFNSFIKNYNSDSRLLKDAV